MFFTHEILTKKGPLFKVWLAAHWKDKLTKAQLFEVDINEICESIIRLKVKMALRLSGHLLVGVVRIHSKKAVFLLEDCISASKTVAKNVKELELELPVSKKHRKAKTDVTLKQDFEIPELDPSYVMAQLEQHNYSSDSITMHEAEAIRSSSFTRLGVSNLMSNRDDSLILPDPHSSTLVGVPRLESGSIDYRSYLATPIQDDGFGAPVGSNILESLVRKQLLRSKETIPDVPAPQEVPVPQEVPIPQEVPAHQEVPVLEPATTIPPTNDAAGAAAAAQPLSFSEAVLPTDPQQQPSKEHCDKEDELIIKSLEVNKKACVRRKKKARLIVDKVKQFSSEEMKDHITDWSDTVTELDLAPPTAKICHLKKTGTAQYMLHSITRPCVASALKKLYNRHLKMRLCDNFGEEESRILSTTVPPEDHDMPPEEQVPELQEIAPPLDEETATKQMQDVSVVKETEPYHAEEAPTVQMQETSLIPETPTMQVEDRNLIQEEREEYSSPSEALLCFCSAVKTLLSTRQEVLFTATVHPTDNRRQVSLKFFLLLALKKNLIIDLQQQLPYSSIYITKGTHFDRPYSEVSA